MRALILTLLALAALVGLFFAAGLDAGLSQWITSTQRDCQNALAGALRGLRAGAPGAVTGFMSICFAYGFLHALGPGHGKAVMGAYAMANDGTLRRMVWLAVTASLAQATVAVLLVHGAILLLGGARDRIEGLATQIEPSRRWPSARWGCCCCGAASGGCGTIARTTIITTTRIAAAAMPMRRMPIRSGRRATGGKCWRWCWASRCGPAPGRCSCC